MRIAFSWNGLPQYAARLIRAAIEAMPEHDCNVIGTPPHVPIQGMEEALGRQIHWVPHGKPTSFEAIGLPIPDIFIQSGWGYPPLNSLGDQVKSASGKVIGISDANWRGDFRQMVLGPIAFRLNHRRRFDAMLVAGKEGRRLMRWFGFHNDQIAEGMYGADPALFSNGSPLAQRAKNFLFVGQFIARKDVTGLADAFVRFYATHPDWSLKVFGGGEQRDQIAQHPAIQIADFLQPEALKEEVRLARFFVLPSLSEAWGLVVHEAALSGCAMVLSDRIGSATDLSNDVNAVRFRAGDRDSLVEALTRAAAFDEAQLAAAQEESLRLGGNFGPDRFAREIGRLVDSLA